MSFEVWLAYVGTVLVLMITPGPSQLLMLSNSIGNGFKRSLATASGDLSANLLQMVVASLGLASLIVKAHTLFLFIKWAGVAYLVYLGAKIVLSSGNGKKSGSRRTSIKKLYLQGFLTSAANPKAVIFFAALFPQFIDPSLPLFTQFVVLSATYLTIDGLFLCCYGKFADTISARQSAYAGRIMNYVAGSLLVGAAVLLGLRDIEQN